VPPNEITALCAYTLTEQTRLYGIIPTSLELTQGPGAEMGNTPRVILDPGQSKAMAIKLLEQQRSMLSDLWKSVEQRAADAASAQNANVDFAPRYFSAACRDLHRAIAHYTDLKRNNL
jgi:hypothetical protein